jgi:flavin-dependent dehydrogenase
VQAILYHLHISTDLLDLLRIIDEKEFPSMSTPIRADRDVMAYDVVVVGAGPAGLSCAIKLKQLSPDLSVCVLEKGSEVGAHLLSGAVFEPRALAELFPDWKERGAPLKTQAKEDRFLFLTKNASFRLPNPPTMNNHGNYIISLGEFGRWLASQAETIGVEIFPGFAASEVLYNEKNEVIGIATGDMGIAKDGTNRSDFTPGVEIHARQTVFAEGCHGSLTKTLTKHYDLRATSDPQTYGLGVKEVWEINPAKHQEGLVIHTIGGPWIQTPMAGHGCIIYRTIWYRLGLWWVWITKTPICRRLKKCSDTKPIPPFATILKTGDELAMAHGLWWRAGFNPFPN